MVVAAMMTTSNGVLGCWLRRWAAIFAVRWSNGKTFSWDKKLLTTSLSVMALSNWKAVNALTANSS